MARQVIMQLNKAGKVDHVRVEGTKGDQCIEMTKGLLDKIETSKSGVETFTTEEYHMVAEKNKQEKEKAEMNWSN